MFVLRFFEDASRRRHSSVRGGVGNGALSARPSSGGEGFSLFAGGGSGRSADEVQRRRTQTRRRCCCFSVWRRRRRRLRLEGKGTQEPRRVEACAFSSGAGLCLCVSLRAAREGGVELQLLLFNVDESQDSDGGKRASAQSPRRIPRNCDGLFPARALSAARETPDGRRAGQTRTCGERL